MVGQMDAQLVAAARSGDQESLDELIAQYLPLVYNIVGRAVTRRSDVDDVVQDTMLRVVRGLGGLREPERFRSWLVAVTMNQVREHGYADRTAPATLEEAAELADPGADFVDLTLAELGLSDQRRETALATRWLEPDDRHLLSLWWLVNAGHLTRTELVAALDLDPHHVTVRVARMKGQLDTARMVVRALMGAPRCPGLADTAGVWRGEENSVWRKRFARHIRECGFCSSSGVDLIPAERLLAGLSLVPLPAGYAAYMLATAHGANGGFALAETTLVSPPDRIPGQRGDGNGSNGAGRGSHRGGSHGAAAGHAGALAAKPLMIIVAVAAVVGVGVATVYAVGRSSPAASRTLDSGPSSAPLVGLPGGSSPSPATASASTTTGASASASPSPSAKPGHSVAPSPSHSPTHKASATSAPAAPSSTSSAGSGGGGSQSTEVTQVLALINKARAQNGLPAYTITSGLTTSATKHNQTMAGGCGLSHQCPGEAALGDRETAAGVHWNSAGENIGEGGPVSNTDSAIAQMAVGLTQSMLDEKPPNDGHRQNILSSSFHHIGIAVYRDGSGTVWLTQDFSN
ncbi:MAG: sigma-70 family RNA polymerase sigma factor [Actinocrinis sp.]